MNSGVKKAHIGYPGGACMEEGKEGEWWGDSENSGTQGVLTGTPSHGGSGEQGQSGPYVQPMMMMQPSNDEATWSMVHGALDLVLTHFIPIFVFHGLYSAIQYHRRGDTRPRRTEESL